MRKILLLSAAATLAAGTARAEVTLSGSARMGIVTVDDGSDRVTSFSSRARIGFTGSGETDSGLTFGASMRADQKGGNDPDNGSGGDTNGDSTVFLSGGFGRVTMGDVNGAADALVGQVSGVGYGPLDDLQEIPFLGTHKTAIYYENSTGPFTFGVGSGQLVSGDRTYNIGAKYSADAWSLALGWESDSFTGVRLVSLGGSASFGPATVKARVSESNFADDPTAFALSVDYVAGATTFTAFYADFGDLLFDTVGPDLMLSLDTQRYGLGASYDLGGGARVAGGIVRQANDENEPDFTLADVGLKFSF